MDAELGICQWFHHDDRVGLERAVALLRELGVRHVRTGVSWADWHRPNGPAWAKRVLDALADFDVLCSVWHTPPSLAETGRCNDPPRRLQDYADFLDQLIDQCGDRIDAIELWNEPNNTYKWNFRERDPDWRKFATMIAMAAHWARRRGVRTVLGGMIPVDPAWIKLLDGHGGLQDIDVIAIHAFPGMWWSAAPNWDWCTHWKGWQQKIASIADAAADRPIWVTETGLATLDLDAGRPARFGEQVQALQRAAAAPIPRLYWYSLIDLDPQREAIEGFHVDENEYHLGLVAFDGTRKPAFDVFKDLLREQRRQAVAARQR